MKFQVSLTIYLLLFTGIHFLCTNNKNNTDLITDSVKSIKANQADSIIYIKDKWGLTTITTLEQINLNKPGKIPNPFAPPTPFKLTVSEVSQIKMDIKDSTHKLMKTYNFNISAPGDYHIEWWAFYKDLPPGKYNYELDLPGKTEKHLIIK